MSGVLDDSIDHIKALRRRLKSIRLKIENRERQIRDLAEGLPELLAERDRIEAELRESK